MDGDAWEAQMKVMMAVLVVGGALAGGALVLAIVGLARLLR